MGSRKRSRPNPKVEAPLEALQNVGTVQAAQAAVQPNPDVHVEHDSSNKDSTSSISNPFIQDASSIKVCFRS
jgi:hypothetical protein